MTPAGSRTHPNIIYNPKDFTAAHENMLSKADSTNEILMVEDESLSNIQ